jgi:hypothetical protein
MLTFIPDAGEYGNQGSGHSNILKNREKTPKNTGIWVLIDRFFPKTGRLRMVVVDPIKMCFRNPDY